MSSVWTIAEESALVDFLVDNMAEAGDGGNFKKAVFQRALDRLAPLHECGAPKTVRTCQNKWTVLRKIYRTICAIQAVSGWTWNDKTGASITPETTSSWDDYVQKHPEAKPFCNRGWCHFPKVALLMPSATSGSHVYHPTLPAPAVTIPNSPESDLPPPPFTPDQDSASDDEPEVKLSSHKCTSTHEPATPTHPAVKCTRTSQGAAALQDISTTMNHVRTALAAALAPASDANASTPQCRTNAIATILHLEKMWLNSKQLIALIDLIERDQAAGDVYLALEDPDVRKEWVSMQLEKLGIIIS